VGGTPGHGRVTKGREGKGEKIRREERGRREREGERESDNVPTRYFYFHFHP